MRPSTAPTETDQLLPVNSTGKGRAAIRRLGSLAACCVAATLWAVAPAMAAERQVLVGHVPSAVAQSRVTGRLAATTKMQLAIGLPLRNAAQLDALLAEINDPTSAQYHQYLTPTQFAAQFGPTEADYVALIAFAQANGLTVTGTHPNRMLLDVAGPVTAVEKAMHVNMVTYTHPVRGAFYAPDREPSLDTDVQTLDVSGLENYNVPQPMGLKTVPMTAGATPYVTGSGPGGYFIGKDFRAAYAPSVTLTGANQVIGLLEFDGFYAADVTKNFAQAGQTAVPVQTVLLDGYSGAAGSDNTEVTLDIMMAAYMAPGLSKIMVYEGTTPNDILNRMATDNLASQISSSWGYNPINATTEQIFKEYIAQGQSVLQASGDSGAYTNGVMPPSDDPNLTVVGGTDLTTNGADGPWQAETAWSGSGGGVSTTYAIPSYQQSVSMASNGGSKTMRNIPDLGMLANPSIYLIQNNGQAIIVGGTSAAAPLWSGFIALANQQAAANAKSRVGFLNPLVYAIGESSNYSADFNDIRSGNNSGYNAVTGFDLTTGWGSPAGQHLINDLTATTTTTSPSFSLSSSTAALTVKQAGTGTDTITVTDKYGFTGSVALTATGLPTGVTAAFSPASATTSSVMTFTASSTAAVGTYTVTVKGTSGTLSSTTTIALTVVAPSFTLSASSASLTVARSGTASNTISVADVNGFSGSVALTATGMPTGVTASFSPTTTTSSSKLTFTASSTATAGTYTVTVTGTSGTLKAATTVSLTVTAPTFTLAASPASVTVPRSSTASSTISVAGQSGFNSSVALTATGMPTGVTASFSPATTTSTSKLTFTVSSTATAGTYTVTVTGTSGTLKATTTVSVTVTAPSFTLAFVPSTLSVTRGATASGTLGLTAVNGFTGGVTVTLSGMPVGVTASFGAVSAAGTGVTFTATSTAALGTSTVTLKGVSGALSASTTFSLTVAAPTSGYTVVNMAPSYNVNALVTDGHTFTGTGLDGGLNGSITAYSANLTGTQQTIAGTLFSFGPANALDSVSGKTVALPAGLYSAIKLLATGVNGAQSAQVFKVTYTDGTSTTVTQSLSDWFTPSNFAGESKAMTMAYRDNGAGQRDNRTFYLYEYALALNPAKTVASITLPNSRNVVVLAATLTH